MASVNPEQIYFNALNLVPQIGSVRFRRLRNFFGSYERAWKSDLSDFLRAGLEEATAFELVRLRSQTDPEEAWSRLERSGVHIILFDEDGYPKILREIAAPPMGIYVKGALSNADGLSVAVVGSRKFTNYGKQAAGDLASGLSRAGITVVSGLALGIDSLVHESALSAGGRTIGVLACGLDSVYPASNRLLGEKMIQEGKGALVSELALGTPPLKHHFPNRNRIISGLALGTVVIEAALKSGALITARHALEQNREVFAVPGSIYNPASEGPNNLLKMGARPVTSVSDILTELNLETAAGQLATQEIIGDTDEETSILKLISKEPTHADAIAKQSGLPASTVASTLTIMEMKGKVKNLGANQYILGR